MAKGMGKPKMAPKSAGPQKPMGLTPPKGSAPMSMIDKTGPAMAGPGMMGGMKKGGVVKGYSKGGVVEDSKKTRGYKKGDEKDNRDGAPGGKGYAKGGVVGLHGKDGVKLNDHDEDDKKVRGYKRGGSVKGKRK